jgi:uncharacterized protein (TIGR02246 family)
MFSRKLCVLLSTVVLRSVVAAGAEPPSPVPASAAQMMAEAKPMIDAANKDWLPAMQTADAKRAAEPYAEDGIFVTKTGQVISGRAAIEQLYKDRFKAGGKVVGGQIAQNGVTVEGALIYEWGRATFEVERDGTRTALGGNYLTVWRRGAGGRWEIIRNLTF